MVSLLKATPSVTALPSPLSGLAGVDVPKMLHGQVGAEASGVTGLEFPEAGPVPTVLVAVTVKV